MTDPLWLLSNSCFEHITEHNSLDIFTLALPKATHLWLMPVYKASPFFLMKALFFIALILIFASKKELSWKSQEDEIMHLCLTYYAVI